MEVIISIAHLGRAMPASFVEKLTCKSWGVFDSLLGSREKDGCCSFRKSHSLTTWSDAPANGLCTLKILLVPSMNLEVHACVCP